MRDSAGRLLLLFLAARYGSQRGYFRISRVSAYYFHAIHAYDMAIRWSAMPRVSQLA